MSILSVSSRRQAGARLVLPRLWDTFAIALVAAAASYGLHHLPPLSGHLLATGVVVLLGAGAAAVAAGAVAGTRREYVLPTVFAAQPGAVQTQGLRAEDLRFCAALHTDALDHGFFVELGPGFLRSYYAAFLDSPHAVALLAHVGDQPVGLLVGSVDSRAHAQWVIRHRGVSLALSGAAGMVLHPAAALRFLRTRLHRYAVTLRRQRGARPSGRGELAAGTAVLSHTAVLRGARGFRAGHLLVRQFEAIARRRGAERAFLITLAGADGAGPFYAALGWERSARRSSPDGRLVEEWSRDLREDDR